MTFLNELGGVLKTLGFKKLGMVFYTEPFYKKYTKDRRILLKYMTYYNIIDPRSQILDTIYNDIFN